MARKGSITIFLTLMLSVILSLVCTSIESVRMAAARTQILCSMDIGLYSLFGQYDRAVLKDYDLFLIDGSCGGGNLKMANVYNNMESYIKPVLKQNSQKLSLTQGGFTGYQLLTDEDGEIFYNQIVQYMKDTLGSQGAQLFLNRIGEQQTKTEEARRRGNEVESGKVLDHYDSEMNTAEQNSEELERKQREAAEQAAQNGSPGTALAPVQPKKKIVNPITVIKRVMKKGVLSLVLPPQRQASNGKVGKKDLLSGRKLQTGMGMVRKTEKDYSYTSQLLYHEYLMNRLGNYQKPAAGPLSYQMEYILVGKKKDKDNLLSIAKQLLVIREGVNIASLMADPVKKSEMTALSVAIASTFLVPPAAGVIEGALATCWAFAESILDIRELFAGGKVPLVKSPEQWQISLGNLPYLLNNLDTLRKNDAEGLSYEDYLQILLLAKGRKDKIRRGMDMLEMSIREKTGNQQFQLDSGVVAIEAAIDVKANKRKNFTVTKQYCYD